MARRLKTPADCRRHLAFIINQVQTGKMEPTLGGKLGYLLNILVRALEVEFQQNTLANLAQRLDAMEDRINV